VGAGVHGALLVRKCAASSPREGFGVWFVKKLESHLDVFEGWGLVCTGELKRDPKAKMLSLQSFLRKGVSLGYVRSI
jgi:hypothetical protein